MNLQEYRTDKTAAERGKWFPFDGAEFLIAAHGTPAYQKALSKAGKQNQRALRRDDYKAINQMTVEVMADTILLDWKGVKNGSEDFPYSRENAITLLSSAMEFRQWVEATAMNLSNFVQGEEAADKAALKSGDPVGNGVGGTPGVSGGSGEGNGGATASTGE